MAEIYQKLVKVKNNKISKMEVIDIVFNCLGCGNEYKTKGVFEKIIEQVFSCSNCCPFYKGKLVGDIKFGRVEKFYARAKKTK